MKKTLLFVALIAVGASLVDWFSEGPPDGPYESYFENGQLEQKGTYKDGLRCGEWFEEGETVTYDPCPPDLEDGN